MQATGWHRLQFGFTIGFHYLFPQLTMGLALLLVVFKTLASRPSARTGPSPGHGADEQVPRPRSVPWWLRDS